MVVGGTDTRQVVKPDEVWSLLPSVHMSEEGSVCGLAHHVGVALQACNERSLIESSLPRVLSVPGMVGILAGEFTNRGDFAHEVFPNV